MAKIDIKTKFKMDIDLKDAIVNIKTDIRVVEVVKGNRQVVIPFESVYYVDFIEEG